MQDPQELIGKDVGPCRVESLLGRGGMGAVFLARHIPLDRPVALKVIRPTMASGEAATEAFLREARMAAKLEDPRIVSVYEVGREGLWRYIVMQLVKGQTLEQVVMRRGAMSPKQSLPLMREVLLGLSAAHRQGVIHRDIKPSNIMVDEKGAVKIMDFGVAAAPGAGQQDPEATPAGSFDFMAPEQAFEPKPDPRMDLYAFGATWFYLLAGRPPYAGSSMEVLLQHRDSAIPDVRVHNREVTPGLAALITRLMQKFPDGRPQSVEEVLKLLESPGLVIAVDPSGSPLRLLPPEPEKREGLAAELAGRVSDAAAEEPLFEGLPPPPPLPAGADPRVSWEGLAVFAGLCCLFFLSPWGSALRADWLAGGLTGAGLLAAVCASRLAGAARVGLGLALTGAMLGSFAGFASGGSGAAAPLELLVFLGLGLAVLGAGLYLGLPEDSSEPWAAAALILASAAVATLAAAAWGRPAEGRWAAAWAELAAQGRAWLAAEGPWRWAGLLAVFGYVRAVRFSGGAFPWENPAAPAAGKRATFNR